MSSPSVSPSKGKTREATHWKAAWWDFYPLAERPKRPVEWSNSSVIFTAHPTQSLVTARHFSSSKQFVIPSPAPVLASPTAYEPPTIISVASGDEWLFAYFPGRSGDGIGCIWKRGTQIDNWSVKECWNFTRSGGVVAAKWLNSPRERVTKSSITFGRLLPRGPLTSITNPTLILVTQDHQAHACYFRQYSPTLKIIKCSLLSPTLRLEGQPVPVNGPVAGSGAIRECVDAAVGLGYGESSILVAMHSRRIPPQSAAIPPFDAMDIDVPIALQPTTDSAPSDWDTWGEEQFIDLCEIQFKHYPIALGYDGMQIGLFTNPLPPLPYPGKCLTDLLFVCTPPGPSSPSEMKSPSLQKRSESEKGKIYLAISHLDFEDFASVPKSELNLYSIIRQPPSPASPRSKEISKPSWNYHPHATRSFGPRVLAFAAPTVSNFGEPLLYAGILDTSGPLMIQQTKPKVVQIGEIKVLNISDLTDHENWESSPIMSESSKAGRDLPLRAAVSPNHMFAFTISSSNWPVQTGLHALPRILDKNGGISALSLSISIASAVLARKSTSDLTHLLSLPSFTTEEVADILFHALEILDKNDNGMPHLSTWDMLGISAGIYRSRAQHSKDDSDREVLTARWQTAHDICSLMAGNMAFEDCHEGEGYDVSAAWQLIGISTWIVNFTERLMKQCVLSWDPTGQQGGNGAQISSNATKKMLESPILLTLIHPYAVQNVLTALRHVRQFRSFLGSLPAGGENAHIAKDVLIDLVDRSGVDFTALSNLLEEVVKASKMLDAQECRKALTLCYPTPTIRPHLHKIIQTVSQSSILHKSTLFIKPSDLVDGVSMLLAGAPKKEKDRDVVTKGILAKQNSTVVCLRCNGRSDILREPLSPSRFPSRWRNWENVWKQRCICGGPWTSPAVNKGFFQA
ncbi:hypothetical protein BDQ12DRAFT_676334 [Crucibulum laeve]|uniref:Mediator complex subunit 16 n=1 Tax=Crucibulum laeve TaxID=68775 RepID=A0A5C3MCN6_9AGAR|nr:hypothetical protein BDQ12DRAFT_676334 [Crucibulum laeve]